MLVEELLDSIVDHGFITMGQLRDAISKNNLKLPDISGEDLIEQFKADSGLRAIPIIAVTAFAMKGDEERIRAKGCESYLSKPISVGRFLEVVQSFTG